MLVATRAAVPGDIEPTERRQLSDACAAAHDEHESDEDDSDERAGVRAKVLRLGRHSFLRGCCSWVSGGGGCVEALPPSLLSRRSAAEVNLSTLQRARADGLVTSWSA